MIRADGTDRQMVDSLLNHLRKQGWLALRTIGERGLLWPLRAQVCWGTGEICLYFRARKPVNRFSLLLHFGTYSMHYPVPYGMWATVYDVKGYKDEQPCEFTIERAPALRGAKAHCYTGRPFRIGGEEGSAGVRPTGANLREPAGSAERLA